MRQITTCSAGEMGLERRSLAIHMQAAAETSLRHQGHLNEQLLAWAKQQQHAGGCKSILYLEYLMYDETPLVCRVSVEGATQTERARLFVVDVSWLCLLQLCAIPGEEAAEKNPSDFLLLRGRFSPQMRAAARCTGEGIKSVLQQCPTPPQGLTHSDYKFLMRVTEGIPDGSLQSRSSRCSDIPCFGVA